MEIKAEDYLEIIRRDNHSTKKSFKNITPRINTENIYDKYKTLEFKYNGIKNNSFTSTGNFYRSFNTPTSSSSKAYSLAMKSMQDNIHEIEDKLEDRNREIDDLNHILKSRNFEIEELKLKLRNKDELLEKAQMNNGQNVYNLELKLKEKEKEIKDMNARLESIIELSNKKNEELMNLTHLMEKQKLEYTGLLAKNDSSINNFNEKLNYMNNLLEKSEEEITKYRDSARKEKWKSEELSNNLIKQKNEFSVTIKEYESDLMKILHDLEVLENENADLQILNKKKDEKIIELTENNSKIKNKLEELNSKLKICEEDFKSESTKSQNIKNLLQEKEDEIAKYENTIKFLKSEISYQNEKIGNYDSSKKAKIHIEKQNTSFLSKKNEFLFPNSIEPVKPMEFLNTHETANENPFNELNEILEEIKENERKLAKANENYNKLLGDKSEEDESDSAWNLVEEIQSLNTNIYNLKRKQEELLNE